MIVYKGRLPPKIEACQVNPGHYMAFKHSILFATHLAANLVVIYTESFQTLFPSFSTPSSEVAVLWDSNLNRLPFLRQVIKLDLLHGTGFIPIQFRTFGFAPVLVLLRDQGNWMNDQTIEQSDEHCFGW